MNMLLQLLDKNLRKSKIINAKATMALALLMMASGSVGLRAQTIADGIYYISHSNGNWYLWPSVVQGTGTTNEYLTTFNATEAPEVAGKYEAHDNTYCHWVVKNVEGVEGAFQLINPKLNKYIVRRGFPKDNNTKSNTYGDRDVWLMENPTGDDLTRSYFYLYKDDTRSPYRITFDKEQDYTFNSATGDKSDLSADNYMSERRNALIQFYAGAPKWAFTDDLLPAPTINYNAEYHYFTITYDKIPEGFEILYTTDGSDPTVGGAGVSTYTETVYPSAAGTVKAVVARYGVVLTGVASQEVEPVDAPPDAVISLPDACGNTITLLPTGATFYYTTDGSEPSKTNGTLYTGPFLQNTDATIKAVLYFGDNRSANVTSFSHTAKTAMPIISVAGNNVTISGNGSIYYTLDGTDPTESSIPYTGPIPLDDVSGSGTIRAVAKDGELVLSCPKTALIINSEEKLNSITADAYCILTADIDAGSFAGGIENFSGTFDGKYHTISGLGKPLFNSIDGGTVKNVVFSDVNISNASHAGAVTNVASGSARIYNCGILGGSVASTGGSAGGLVGQVAAGSSVRVVNCYNYATVSGSDYAAGIVGKNDGTVGDVRIALCMMYGDMTTGTNRSPVYGGYHVSNSQNFTEYNYWRSKADLTYTAYNDQLAIDKDDYLTRFPFYRHILNTHRQLAAFFLFGETGETVNDITADEVAEIGHWVLKEEVASYPIIEEWQTNTRKVLDAPAGPLVSDDNLGTSLSVTIKIDDASFSAALPITDMDEANYDYTWGKVVLPFANEFVINDDYSRICTGWKITGITGGNGAAFEKYNVSDRNCTDKDLYSNTGYIFAQGGNYIVPYNVTAITIEANFAKAYYLSDPAYERGLDASYGSATNLGGTVPATYHGQPVATNLKTLLGTMPAAANPHVQAIVLVGNYHFNDGDLGNYSKAFTLMSIDADNNQEPDYGFYAYNSADRPGAPSMRFDFLPVIPVGMAAHVTSSAGYPGVPIWKVRGWFEMTETCVFYTSQCEIESSNFINEDDGRGNNRWIVNSGYFVQIVRSRTGDCRKVSYIQMGGNVFVEEFYPGSHTDNDKTTTLVPVNVTGGEIKSCFMTGYSSQPGAHATGDNIYFWCAGGKIHKFLGAYMETPFPQTSGSKVNMTANIDHAIIGRYFGGGTSAKASIGGKISTTISNSKVDFYCGGPEFSSADEKPIVETKATNTTFGEYYGAGFGGTAITYARIKQDSKVDISNDRVYPISFNEVYKRLDETTDGIGSCYKFEYIYHSYERAAVARSYTGYAQFSLATTGSVTNQLTNCKVKKLAAEETIFGEATSGDFYGAGCQGQVDGTVESTLMHCEVEGSAYGGGYRAKSNEVSVYPATQPTYSVYKRDMALFTDFGEFPAPETFLWKPGTVGADDSKKELYTGMTQEQMNNLGNVSGDISITIGGNSKIGTAGDGTTGGVYGGGNESISRSNATVTLKDNTEVLGNVYGGGNLGNVSGSTSVTIDQ